MCKGANDELAAAWFNCSTNDSHECDRITGEQHEQPYALLGPRGMPMNISLATTRLADKIQKQVE